MNREFVKQEGKLAFIAAAKAVVTVGSSTAQHKVCHIMFAKDGSIFVQSPYFERRSGIVSAVTIPPGTKSPYTFNLAQDGKVTSHLVKLTHHTDGEVHFSQDGKVLTAVGRKSFSLASSIGHVFRLTGYHLRGFEQLTKKKKDVAYLPFVLQGALPEAVTVWAMWRRKSDIIASTQPAGQSSGPLSEVQNRVTGVVSKTFFLGQPSGYALQDFILLVAVEPAMPLPKLTDPTMVMLGGWDHHEVSVMGQEVEQTGVLTWIYPFTPTQSLGEQIGSIDFTPAIPK